MHLLKRTDHELFNHQYYLRSDDVTFKNESKLSELSDLLTVKSAIFNQSKNMADIQLKHNLKQTSSLLGLDQHSLH